ncbi:unnamed protein product [Rotaria sp. Silwood1]|nr:unnamed protein product [Rotaria sp. Silwood1]
MTKDFNIIVCGSPRVGKSTLINAICDQHYTIIKDEANVKYFANVALCTAVNSIVYEDQEMGIKKEAEGINELIFGVMTSLKDHDLAGWCLTVAENNKFWTDMKIKVEEFFRASRPFIRFCCKEVGRQMVSSLIDFILNTASEEM